MRILTAVSLISYACTDDELTNGIGMDELPGGGHGDESKSSVNVVQSIQN
jgi:hypothetical protein